MRFMKYTQGRLFPYTYISKPRVRFPILFFVGVGSHWTKWRVEDKNVMPAVVTATGINNNRSLSWTLIIK